MKSSSVGMAALSLLIAGCGSLSANHAPTLDVTLAAAAMPCQKDNEDVAGCYNLAKGTKLPLTATAKDRDGDDPITITWNGATPVEKAPQMATFDAKDEGDFTVVCTASDGRLDGDTAKQLRFVVTAPHGKAPKFASLLPESVTVTPGSLVPLVASATDADGDTVRYEFLPGGGAVDPAKPADGKTTYTAPSAPGTYTIFCIASDGHGQITTGSLTVTVK
jgi:plastocyanin